MWGKNEKPQYSRDEKGLVLFFTKILIGVYLLIIRLLNILRTAV